MPSGSFNAYITCTVLIYYHIYCAWIKFALLINPTVLIPPVLFSQTNSKLYKVCLLYLGDIYIFFKRPHVIQSGGLLLLSYLPHIKYKVFLRSFYLLAASLCQGISTVWNKCFLWFQGFLKTCTNSEEVIFEHYESSTQWIKYVELQQIELELKWNLYVR